MAGWAEAELTGSVLPDVRLGRRLVRLVTALAERPASSVPEACGSWAATKAAYRFWSCERVTPKMIQQAHIEQTMQRVATADRILVIQDTTEIDVTHHPATQGVGHLRNHTSRGLNVHTALAVGMDGVPAGIVHQEIWARDVATMGKKHTRRQRSTNEKESQRWLTSWQATQAAIPEGVATITVADREADIYDLFAMERQAGHELLVRATHNRRVEDKASYLWDALRDSPVLGQIDVKVARAANRLPEPVRLTARAIPVRIRPPRHRSKREGLSPIALHGVLLTEDPPPPKVKAIRWLLLATWPITTLDAVRDATSYYRLRWLIERYHYTLKSGCGVEELQLEAADRLERAVATYCIVAWRLLWLTYLARAEPDAPATIALEEHEWQALYCFTHRVAQPPDDTPTLHQAVRWIAQLGGFLGRKGDGQPGVKVIWRGLRRLEDIAATWQVLHGRATSTPTDRLVGNA